MITRWIMEAAGLFATTAGALVIFMVQSRLGAALDTIPASQAGDLFGQQFRRLSIALALLAASLVVQCAGMFFI